MNDPINKMILLKQQKRQRAACMSHLSEGGGSRLEWCLWPVTACPGPAGG